MSQLRHSIEDFAEEKRNAGVLTQRANESLHRTQKELIHYPEARTNHKETHRKLNDWKIGLQGGLA